MRVPQGPLQQLFASAEGGLRRISVELDGEQVTFVARAAAIHAVCTCGLTQCTHIAQAFALFDAEVEPASPREPAVPRAPMPLRASLPGGNRESRPLLAAVVVPAQAVSRSSSRPPPPAGPTEAALADAIDELVLATARAGVSHAESASIKAALEQLIACVGSPAPIGMARFVGRFGEAMHQGEVGRVGRLLDGLAGFGAALRAGPTAPSAQALRRAWLSRSDAPTEPMTDTVLVEVAREWLHGISRYAIERRYFVELATGALLCEERPRGAADISVGPCPRVVHVAYGEVESAMRPRRLRLLQYSIEVEPSLGQWQALAGRGVARFSDLLVRFTRELAEAPALAEPFALVRPTELEDERGGALRDADGDRLELSDDSGGVVLPTLHRLAQDGNLMWIAGRLRGTSRGISLRPTSLLVQTAQGYSLRRVT
jgi:hypothetical protein